MALDDRPHAARVRIVGGPVVQQNRGAVDEPAGDEPGTHHPPDVGEPPQDVPRLEVEHVREVLRRFDGEPAVHVHGTFRPPRRTRSVNEHVRIFGRGIGETFVLALRHHEVRGTTITVRTLGAPSTAASAVSFICITCPRRKNPSAVMSTLVSQSRSRPAIASLAYPEKMGV